MRLSRTLVVVASLVEGDPGVPGPEVMHRERCMCLHEESLDIRMVLYIFFVIICSSGFWAFVPDPVYPIPPQYMRIW